MLLLLRVNISYFIYVLNLGSINFEINKVNNVQEKFERKLKKKANENKRKK